MSAQPRGNLEKFLRGEPQTEALQQLAEEVEEVPVEAPVGLALAPQIGAIDDDDREHLRRMLLEPGWRVLLKLLDTDIAKREDAARDVSLLEPLSGGEQKLSAVWVDVSYRKKARAGMLALAEAEVEKLRHGKK